MVRKLMWPRSTRRIDPLFISYLLLGLVVYGLSVILMPLVVAAAGHRPFRIGAVVALQNIGLLSAPLWGIGMDRFGRHRLVLSAGCILIAIGFLGLTFFISLDALLAYAFCIGIGTASATTATMVFTIERRPPGEWSGRIGYLQLFNSFGTTMGLWVSGILPVHAGTMLGAGVAVIAALLARLTLPARAIPFAGNPSPEKRPAGKTPDTLAEARSNPAGLASLLTGWFLFVTGMACFSSPYPIIMHRVFDIGIRSSSGVMALATSIGLPLYAISGLAIRRIGSSSVLIAGMACRLACLSGVAILAYHHPDDHRLILLTVVGLFQACWPMITVSINDQLFKASSLGQGLSTGLLTCIGASASAAGALVGGVIADHGGYRLVVPAAAILMGLATGQMIWRFSTHRPPKSGQPKSGQPKSGR